MNLCIFFAADRIGRIGARLATPQFQISALTPRALYRLGHVYISITVGFAQKVGFSPQSGRLIVAQQFTAGDKLLQDLESVKRTAE